MKHTSALLIGLLLLATPAFAGGDYSRGIIGFVRQSNGFDVFQFVQPTGDIPLLDPSCRSYLIAIRSTLNRELHDEKEESLDYLRSASKSRNLVNFGYLGGGLIRTNKQCSYLAEDLDFGQESGAVFVLAKRHEA